MQLKSGVAFEPGPHIGMFVSPVVVQDQVQRDFTWKLLIQSAQEAQELLMPMSLITLANHLPPEGFQSGKQGSGAVTFIVVRHRSTPPFLDGQSRLRSI